MTVPVTVMESMVVTSLDAGLFFALERVIEISAVNTSEEEKKLEIFIQMLLIYFDNFENDFYLTC